MNAIKLNNIIKSLTSEHELKLYYEIGGQINCIKITSQDSNIGCYTIKCTIKDGWLEVRYITVDTIEVKAVDIDLIKAYEINIIN